MKYELYVEIEGINLFIIGNFHKAEYEYGLLDRFEIDVIKSEDDNLYDLLEWVCLRKKYYIEELENKSSTLFGLDKTKVENEILEVMQKIESINSEFDKNMSELS